MAPCCLVRRLPQACLELAELGVDRTRKLARRRRHELHPDGVEHPHQHRARGVVTVDLPAPDVAPVRADGVRQLLLRQAGSLTQLAEPVPESRIGLRRRTPIRRHGYGANVERRGELVQSRLVARKAGE